MSTLSGQWLHFIEKGKGDPVVLIHGIPTSAYLWRNIIPKLVAKNRRIIALDLVNFGYSDKDLLNTIIPGDYEPVLTAFVETLGLKNVSLVLHDIGGKIGFLYAARHAENVRAIAFMETATSPFLSVNLLPPAAQLLRNPIFSQQLTVEQNFFIETFLGNNIFNNLPTLAETDRAMLRFLTTQEFAIYSKPFVEKTSRVALMLGPQIPVLLGENGPQPQLNQYREFATYLASANIPKLAIFGNPGFANPPDLLLSDPISDELVINPETGLPYPSLRELYSSIWPIPAEIQDMKTPTKHFIQEDAPEELGQILRTWLDKINKTTADDH